MASNCECSFIEEIYYGHNVFYFPKITKDNIKACSILFYKFLKKFP